MGESPENRHSEKEERLAENLEAGVAEIKTSDQAARAIDSLERSAGDVREEDVAPVAEVQTSPEAASFAGTEAKTESVIETVAAQAASAAPEDKQVVDEAVARAMGGASEESAPPAEVRHGRRLLRHALFRRLRPLQAIDAFAFVQINQLPHTALTDGFMKRLSWVMTGGAGWLLVLAVGAILDPQRGRRAACAVAPALWLATATVEYPIKKWFRRRRPFVSLVEAIIVGRKPGSYSFPSGHSAAAFAGAVLLAREYPAGARGFLGLAALVAFSRIYLGAHYPGDVMSGSLAGAMLARVYSRMLRKLTRSAG